MQKLVGALKRNNAPKLQLVFNSGNPKITTQKYLLAVYGKTMIEFGRDLAQANMPTNQKTKEDESLED